MPAEWAPHERTLMAWPARAELWGTQLAQAKAGETRGQAEKDKLLHEKAEADKALADGKARIALLEKDKADLATARLYSSLAHSCFSDGSTGRCALTA